MSTGRADTTSKQLSDELFAAQTLFAAIDSPRSLAASMLLAAGDYAGLMDLKVNPLFYQNAGDFADDYLVTEVLKKSRVLPLGVDRVAVATASFYQAEKRCWETNHRLCVEDHPQWFYKLKHEVSKILGPLSTKNLGELPGLFRHGPGATTSVRGIGSIPSQKYDGEIHLTQGLVPFLHTVQGELWWETTRKNPKTVVEGNRFTTVPKNAKTDRGICIEPGLNLFVQLGIGALMRRALQRSGVDLNHTADTNRLLAGQAWSKNLATIDLSQASDSVASVLVTQLLPPRWSHLLGLARSPSTLIDGQRVVLEKHSSMGNGYTFELETILFLALVRTFVPPEEHELVSVFGDDIICPQAYAPIVIEALKYCGFEVNGEKSFLAGSFFESCGRDFFQGVPVRPFYLRQTQDSGIPFMLQVANRLRLYAQMRGVFGCDARFKQLWSACVEQVPKHWRACRVPPVYGDSGIISAEDEVLTPRQTVYSRGWVEGTDHLFMLMRPQKKEGQSHFHRLVALAQAGCGEALFNKGLEPVRGFLRKPVRRPAVSVWPNGLSWLT